MDEEVTPVTGHIDPYAGPEPYMLEIDGEMVDTRKWSAAYGQPVDEAEDPQPDPDE